ncbi:MAG TPA: DNA polymerase III subunit delta' [Vicinamibacterales bacterium]|nr:DNA polymerase III subunit delta' [Vicinamibacterales bacterium]
MPFREVIGHRRLVTLLSRAIAHETLPPSLLFAGPHGVGKRRTAVAVAETINCQATLDAPPLPRDACGECASCRRIARGVHPDVLIVEPGDLGSIKIEQVRDVVDRAGYRPFEGRRRVVIIDDADAMVDAAQNALLKTLEEPPQASIFILVSAMPDALLPTVLSRCQRLRFGELSAAEITEALMRDHKYDETEARAAAVDADGSIGRALSALSDDVTEARAMAHRVLEQAVRQADPGRRIDLAREVTPSTGGKTSGAERERLAACLRALASLLRDIGLVGAQGDAAVLANADLAPQLRVLARSYDSDRTVRAYASVDEALVALKSNVSPKIVADWLVLQL